MMGDENYGRVVVRTFFGRVVGPLVTASVAAASTAPAAAAVAVARGGLW